MARIQLVQVEMLDNGHDGSDAEPISRPSQVLPLLKGITRRDREVFICLHLDARNRPVSMETVSVGTAVASLVHPRELFKAAILNNATGIILAHNHPSGDTTPSQEDIDLTHRLSKAGELLGIEVLDHIVVSQSQFFSMSEGNLLGKP